MADIKALRRVGSTPALVLRRRHASSFLETKAKTDAEKQRRNSVHAGDFRGRKNLRAAWKFLHSTLRRVACFECGQPASPVGEAVRVDLAEGGYEVVHTCVACVKARQGRGALAA